MTESIGAMTARLFQNPTTTGNSIDLTLEERQQIEEVLKKIETALKNGDLVELRKLAGVYDGVPDDRVKYVSGRILAIIGSRAEENAQIEANQYETDLHAWRNSPPNDWADAQWAHDRMARDLDSMSQFNTLRASINSTLKAWAPPDSGGVGAGSNGG